MSKNNTDNWHGFFQENFLLNYFTSFWRSRNTYNIIKRHKIKSILELGAGTGLCAKYLSEKTQAAITLLDRDPNLVEILKVRFPNFDIVKKDLFKFKTRQKWDLVYSLGVIEHFSSQQRIQALKIHRHLSRKFILISVPTDSFIQKNILYPIYTKYIGPYKMYQPQEMINEIKQAELKIIKVSISLFSMTVLAEKTTN